MDQRISLFRRPHKRNAVAIVNPMTGEQQTYQKPTQKAGGDGGRERERSSAEHSMKVHRPPRVQASSEATNASTFTTATSVNDDDPDFNVYARPFVPETFTVINSLHGLTVLTPTENRIDFTAYVHQYMGTEFLPLIPTLEDPPRVDNASNLTNATGLGDNTRYGPSLRDCISEEIAAQAQENAGYSLYGHEVSFLFYPSLADGDDGAMILSFHVPGLRENSPYLEEGDGIEMRQLIMDGSGKPNGMQEWLSAPLPYRRQVNYPGYGFIAGGRLRGEPAPGWTNHVYKARVLAVQRRDERLQVKVRGLLPSYTVQSRSTDPVMVFNIQFPVSQDRYSPMLNVLPVVQKALSAKEHPTFRNGWFACMLSPTAESNELQTKLNPWKFDRPFFDNALNREQKKAVESVCSQDYGCIPYLISGPPGTGKTKTLVETALQLIHNVDGIDHILFCAPSDQAADTLVQRLAPHLRLDELLRLNRASRTFAEVSDKVLLFCYIANNTFSLPPLRQMMKYRIVVTTCRDAALLMYARLTNMDLYAVEKGLLDALYPDEHIPQRQKIKPHWTALLMDEAAQAIEPEALIAISVIAPPSCVKELTVKPIFVLAGDEHQLGPRTALRSSPLKTSLFARLFARPVYKNHPLARGAAGRALPMLTKAMLPIRRPAFANLNKNYRSHPAILAVPSSLFYADTLEPEATDTDRLSSWAGWRGKKWPVLFYSNNSADDLEADGGGWFNKGEAEIACNYAARLVSSGLVKQEEICIMSPFKSQVQVLRRTIRDKKYGALYGVDIGPMEVFQGLERGVVILCTTRSRQKYVSNDQELDWGIVGLPNKMNVALTRAKFGLIVVGSKNILMSDPNWKAFVDFCTRNGLLAGESDEGVSLIEEKYVSLTRLEKLLLARHMNDNESETDGTGKGKRALRGTVPEDEMWENEIHGVYEEEPHNGAEVEYDENESMDISAWEKTMDKL